MFDVIHIIYIYGFLLIVYGYQNVVVMCCVGTSNIDRPL